MKQGIVFAIVCLLVVFALVGPEVVLGDTYTLHSGQTLSRDLWVLGGYANLEPSSHVTGSLMVAGGSITANGQIDGNVRVTGGNLLIGSSAVVRGSATRSGGDLRVANGASIQQVEYYVLVLPAPLQEFLNSALWHAIWPLVLLAVGLICLAGVRLGKKRVPGLAVPGSVITMLGLVLLLQNTFNQYQTWAYAWTLILPTSVGLGLYIEGVAREQMGMRALGLRVAKSGLLLFVIFAGVFELAVNLSGIPLAGVGRIAIAALLILIGAAVTLLKLPSNETEPRTA